MSHQLPPISLSPAASRHRVLWLRSLYLLTFLAIVSAPIAISIKLLLLSLLAVTRWSADRHIGLFRANDVVGAEIKSSGRSRIQLLDGTHFRAQLRRDSVVTPWVILLRFDVKSRWRCLVMVLFMDSLPTEEMRQLRVFLMHSSFSNQEN
ncbi:MAG: hypothetical protein KUF74_11090 [Candidatus Thiodiazotropha sp. (ex Ctena orbiculata)]|nr:hypothetical protein [Candidatus Thiodiazotropha taylori]